MPEALPEHESRDFGLAIRDPWHHQISEFHARGRDWVILTRTSGTLEVLGYSLEQDKYNQMSFYDKSYHIYQGVLLENYIQKAIRDIWPAGPTLLSKNDQTELHDDSYQNSSCWTLRIGARHCLVLIGASMPSGLGERTATSNFTKWGNIS